VLDIVDDLRRPNDAPPTRCSDVGYLIYIRWSKRILTPRQ
jgi:hypothetical protein